MKKQIFKLVFASAVVLGCSFYVSAKQEDAGGGGSVSCPTGEKYKCTSKETPAGTEVTRKGEGEVIITLP